MSSVDAKTRNSERCARYRANNLEYDKEQKREYHRRRRALLAQSHKFDDVMSEHEGASETVLYLSLIHI